MDPTVRDSGMSKDKAVVPKFMLYGNSRRTLHKLPSPRQNPLNLVQRILQEDLFLGMLCLERKRAERSGKGFLLLLIDSRAATESSRQVILKGMIRAANAARRETDLAGWYKQESILGIIFTDLRPLHDSETSERLLGKIYEALQTELGNKDLELLNISFQFFPDDATVDDDDNPTNPSFYPDLLHQRETKTISTILKRVMDIVGSAAAVILFSPLFFLIAVMVKLTSKGPVLFKQRRLGRFGKTFAFLKFRSMYADNDPRIHEEFMKRLISGANDEAGGECKPAFKMRHDPRVTPLGRLLRRTSMDELPQFINVLKGEMSLVGPRPPIPYEYEEYDVWHRRRVLEIKPGITGLWQVKGRSRVAFDDIVRLDLRYAQGWSLWLDLQILAQTPRAVLLGDGAY